MSRVVEAATILTPTEIDLRVDYLGVGKNFDPQLGFAPRTGVRKYSSRLAYRPRLGGTIRQLRLHVAPELVTDSDNDTETVEIELQPLGILWESGEKFEVEIRHVREVIDTPFTIENVTIPAGAYTFRRVDFELETSTKRPVSGRLAYQFGSFFDGYRQDVRASIAIRASARASGELEYEFNDVDLAGGRFDIHVARLRLDLQFSPRASWSNFVQFDNSSDEIGWNSRLWWILQPGRELFLVFNRGWTADAGNYNPLDLALTAKIGYTFRY